MKRMRVRSVARGLCALWLVMSCGNPTGPEGQAKGKSAQVQQGTRVSPPFAVRGELEGLLIVWFDEGGRAHPVVKRSEIPEGARGRVRIDSLEVAPDTRLDPGLVYVADVRTAEENGDYPVHTWSREAFEAQLSPEPVEVAAVADPGVILYGASWCGACKQAAQFLTQRGVPFVEKDIEKEPGARQEMLQKAKAQGVSTQGIPVLDVHGKLLPGFDPVRLGALLDQAHAKGS